MTIDTVATFPDWLIPCPFSSEIFFVTAAMQILKPGGPRVGAPWMTSSSLLLR